MVADHLLASVCQFDSSERHQRPLGGGLWFPLLPSITLFRRCYFFIKVSPWVVRESDHAGQGSGHHSRQVRGKLIYLNAAPLNKVEMGRQRTETGGRNTVQSAQNTRGQPAG